MQKGNMKLYYLWYIFNGFVENKSIKNWKSYKLTFWSNDWKIDYRFRKKYHLDKIKGIYEYLTKLCLYPQSTLLPSYLVI